MAGLGRRVAQGLDQCRAQALMIGATQPALPGKRRRFDHRLCAADHEHRHLERVLDRIRAAMGVAPAAMLAMVRGVEQHRAVEVRLQFGQPPEEASGAVADRCRIGKVLHSRRQGGNRWPPAFGRIGGIRSVAAAQHHVDHFPARPRQMLRQLVGDRVVRIDANVVRLPLVDQLELVAAQEVLRRPKLMQPVILRSRCSCVSTFIRMLRNNHCREILVSMRGCSP